MAYEYKASDVFDLANVLNGETHTKGNELFFKHCPYCKGGGKDKETFSINLKTGTFKCFRASCGKQGHFVEMARDFDYRLTSENVKYKKLPQKKLETKPKAVEYLETRGISRKTAEKYSITTQRKNENILVFPFYDENNVLQFVKYRNINHKQGDNGNKEWCEKDTKPILFGMAQCVDFETLVITEGQIDSLSLAECEIQNAVSVPTGAMGFTWLTHCWDWINKFKKVVVFGDCEKGEITLLDRLQKSLKTKVLAVRQEDYLHEKDANAILTKYGKEAILNAVNNAEIQQMKKIKKLSDIASKNLCDKQRIKTGFNTFDRFVGGLYYGQTILLSGKRGEGKSTVMSQIVAEALEQNISSLVYSGELPNADFKNWLDFQIAGKSELEEIRNEYGDFEYFLSKQKSDKINNWYDDKAYIYDNDVVDDETDSLLDIIEQAIVRYDVKLVCLDNLMTAITDDLGSDIYRQQAKFVKKLKALSRDYNIVIILVAHPKKEKGDFENDSVSGSSVITDVVDIVMNYQKANDEESHDGEITVTKNRVNGKLIKKGYAIEKILVDYSTACRRVVEVGCDLKKVYSCFKPEFEEIIDEDCPFLL